MTLKEWLALPSGEKSKVPLLKMPIAVKTTIFVVGALSVSAVLYFFITSSLQPTEKVVPYDRFARFEETVRSKSICIGMSEEQVYRSWGEPKRVNRTVSKGITSDHVRKQLVYGHQYVYVEDGVVTTFQD